MNPSNSRHLKILQVFNQYLDAGGEEIWVDRMGMMSDDYTDIEDLRFYSRSWKGRGAPGFFKQALWLGNNPDARRILREEVDRFKPEALVFHNVTPVGSLGLYEEAQILGLPVIQYIHNFRPFSPSGTLWFNGQTNPEALSGNMWPEVLHASWEGSPLKTILIAYHLKKSIRRGLLQKIDLWIAVSEFMRSKFIEAGVPEEKVISLRHCWKTNPDPKPVEEGEHYLFLGRLVPEKGVGTLIDAWKILESRLGKSCPKLVIAGSGPLESKLKLASNSLSNISFTGFVSGERKSDLLRRCRGLIAPSLWWEPLGLIVYEAYESKRLVIAARSGGLPETVHPEITGFLHDPGNPTSLADAVTKSETLGSSGRAILGAAGRTWLETNASPEQWLKDFRSIVSCIIPDHGS